MPRTIHYTGARHHLDAQDLVDTDHGALADQMGRCAHGENRRFHSRQRRASLLQFLRSHFVTFAVLCALLVVATALAF